MNTAEYYSEDSFISDDSNCILGIAESFKEEQNDHHYQDNNINNQIEAENESHSSNDDNENESITDKEISGSSKYTNDDDNDHSKIKYDTLQHPIDKIKDKMEYHLSPEKIPRPSRSIEQFEGRDGTNLYSTNIKELIYHPNANSNYEVIETENSSIGLIRPSFHILSRTKDFYDKTKLKFGLCIEPFKDEGNIQSIMVNPSQEIVKCDKCGGYYTGHSVSSEYKINSSINHLLFVCCVCNNQKEVDSSTYCWKQFKQVSIDYLVPSNGKCVEYVMFVIDLSSEAIENNFSSYIVESIKNTIDTIDKKDNRKICITTIDEQQMCFYYLKKNASRMIKVNDLNRLFIPLPPEVLFSDFKCLYNLLDNINDQIAIKKKQHLDQMNRNRNKFKRVNLLDALIKATNDLSSSSVNNRIESYYHIIIFLINPFDNNILAPKTFLSNNNHANILLKLNAKVTYDLFIVSSDHKSNDNTPVVYLQNYSNPNIIPHYYQIKLSKKETYLQYERLYYDLFHLFNSQRYYDIQFNLITREEFNAQLLSPYPIEQSNSYPHIISSTNDLMISYDIQYKAKELFHPINYPFQFWMTYLNPRDNCHHHRVLSYKSSYTDKIGTLFSSIDISALLSLTIHGEIKRMLTANKSLNDSMEILNKNIEAILFNALYEYKANVYIGETYDSFSFPFTLSSFPMYLYSFSKLKQFRLFKLYDQSLYHNSIYCKLRHLLHCPIANLSNQLYTQMLQIDQDDIKEIPLSILFIEMNMCLLYDDGDMVTLFIMNGISKDKLSEIACGCNLNDCSETIKESIVKALDDVGNNTAGKHCNSKSNLRSELMKHYNKVFHVEVIDDEISVSHDFLLLFKEDSLFIGEKSYDEFIWDLNQKILMKCLTSL